MIKTQYKKKANQIIPGFTYRFEWPFDVIFEGIYIRKNSINDRVYLFKSINRSEFSPVYDPVDLELDECVWMNDSSWPDLLDIFEIDKPDYIKPTFDKKEEFSAALVFSGLKMHGLNFCPQCGKEGKWIRMAIVCPNHGVYGGA